MSTEEIKVLVSELVEEKLTELLGDPETDKELKEEVIERLSEHGKLGRDIPESIPAQDFARKLGLKW